MNKTNLTIRIDSDFIKEEPNKKTNKAMKDAEENKMFGPYDSVDDLMDVLDA